MPNAECLIPNAQCPMGIAVSLSHAPSPMRHAPYAMSLMSAPNMTAAINNALYSSLGYDREELLSMRVLDI